MRQILLRPRDTKTFVASREPPRADAPDSPVTLTADSKPLNRARDRVCDRILLKTAEAQPQFLRLTA